MSTQVRLRLLILLGLAVLLAGCARNRANSPEERVPPAIPLSSITILPVTTPETLYTNNRSAPVIGWLWVALANVALDKSKSAEFDAQYGDYRRRSGDKLAGALQRELQAKGFSVRVAAPAEVERDAEGTPSLRERKGHDAVLQISLNEIAMYSARLDVNYLPLINATATMTRPAVTEDSVLDTYYSYGAYASRNGNGYIQSDPRFGFPSFEALMSQPELVMASYDEGIDKIALELTNDITKQFRPSPRLVRESVPSATTSSSAVTGDTGKPAASTAKKAKATKASAAKAQRQAVAKAPATKTEDDGFARGAGQ